MHGSALRCVRSDSRSIMEYGKFDPSVNRKRLKILRSRLGYIITLRSRVVMQNSTKVG